MSYRATAQAFILDTLLNGAPVTSLPTNWYVAALKNLEMDLTTTPDEVSGGSYARVSVTRNTTSFPNATTGNGVQQTRNAVAITFPTATADWGTVTYLGFYDAATNGNIWFFVPIGTTTINAGQQLSLSVNALLLGQR